jgi:hypothetical protein
MEYNTGRGEMRIAEYGRNIQKMIAHIKTLPTKEERNKAANAVVNIMTILNPEIRQQSEYKHKLWDHLFVIAGYDLDIDAPFPVPPPLDQAPPPIKPSYSSNHIKYRYYGKNVERMIQKASAMEPGAERDAFVNALASYMKMAYRVWNEDKVPDEIIIKHVAELSKGKLEIDSITEFAVHNENYNLPKKQGQGQQNRQQQGGKGQHFRHKNAGKKNFRRNP